MSELSLPRLYERDIDFLLQEELIFNPMVQQIFCDALKISRDLRIEKCGLSVSDTSGETDVFAEGIAGNQRCAILIENKIDAVFQPRQGERYKERIATLSSGEKFQKGYCVLVAPKKYTSVDKEDFRHFDAIISYEEIADAVRSEETLRARHRAALLLRAMEQAHSAYLLVPIAEVGNLWARIYDIALAEFPQLQMTEPKDKGAQSKWIIFKMDLPSGVTIDWKVTKPSMELSFWKKALTRPSENIELTSLGPSAEYKKLGDTDAITIPLARPPAEWTALTDNGIREALQIADKLYRFYKSNPAFFVSRT